MYFTPTIQGLTVHRNGTQPLSTTDQALDQAERIVGHFVRRGVLRADGRAAGYLRSIFAVPPEALRVSRFVRRIYSSRRTVNRHFKAEGLPSCRDWIMLARLLITHRIFTRGGPLHRAAYAAGYPDPFTMSAAFRRIIGLRPSQLRDVCWEALLDLWITRQRERGTITAPPPRPPRTCPVCGGPRAA